MAAEDDLLPHQAGVQHLYNQGDMAWSEWSPIGTCAALIACSHCCGRSGMDHDPGCRLFLLWPTEEEKRLIDDLPLNGRYCSRKLSVVLLGLFLGIREFASQCQKVPNVDQSETGSAFIGDLKYFCLKGGLGQPSVGSPRIPLLLFAFYQCFFCVSSTAALPKYLVSR